VDAALCQPPSVITIHTRLSDGTPICIRRVRIDDRQRLSEGIAKLTERSRYLRFFSKAPLPPRAVIDRLVDADGQDHIAWGALQMNLEERPALGVVHAFRDEDEPDSADFSVAVIDEFHGRGLARILSAVLLIDCRREGYQELSVQILAENTGALALAKSLGGTYQSQERGVTELEIDIDKALEALRKETDFADTMREIADQMQI